MSDSDAGGDASERDQRAVIPGFGPSAEAPPDASNEPPPSSFTVRRLVLVLGGVVLVAIAVVMVLVLLFFTVIGDAIDDVESSRDETAITAKQYSSIKVGMREEAVRDKLGEPADETIGDGRRETTCLYYNEKDAGLIAGDRYEFCFVDGRLDSKARE